MVDFYVKQTWGEELGTWTKIRKRGEIGGEFSQWVGTSCLALEQTGGGKSWDNQKRIIIEKIPKLDINATFNKQSSVKKQWCPFKQGKCPIKQQSGAISKKDKNRDECPIRGKLEYNCKSKWIQFRVPIEEIQRLPQGHILTLLQNKLCNRKWSYLWADKTQNYSYDYQQIYDVL